MAAMRDIDFQKGKTMSKLGTAVRAFFRALGDEKFARRVAAWMESGEEAPAKAAAAKVQVRHDALGVVAVLQREARLVDFLREPIGGYTDAQVGAAVRDIHRDAGKALERMFGLKPLLERSEGEAVEVEEGYDPGRIRLAGNVAGNPPYRGKVCHPGWLATRCEVPEWTGSGEAAWVVAPADVQIG